MFPSVGGAVECGMKKTCLAIYVQCRLFYFSLNVTYVDTDVKLDAECGNH